MGLWRSWPFNVLCILPIFCPGFWPLLLALCVKFWHARDEYSVRGFLLCYIDGDIENRLFHPRVKSLRLPFVWRKSRQDKFAVIFYFNKHWAEPWVAERSKQQWFKIEATALSQSGVEWSGEWSTGERWLHPKPSGAHTSPILTLSQPQTMALLLAVWSTRIFISGSQLQEKAEMERMGNFPSHRPEPNHRTTPVREAERNSPYSG